MKTIDSTRSSSFHPLTSSNREIQLIDLFVDLCFHQMDNPLTFIQFKKLAYDLKYSFNEIDHVIKIGKNEYEKLVMQVEAQLEMEFLG